jgi:hypothetical protein
MLVCFEIEKPSSNTGTICCCRTCFCSEESHDGLATSLDVRILLVRIVVFHSSINALTLLGQLSIIMVGKNISKVILHRQENIHAHSDTRHQDNL